jgi:hypothetical protein
MNTHKDPKKITIKGKEFIIHKWDPIIGKRLIFTYLPTLIPKFGNFDEHEKLSIESLAHVSVETSPGVMVDLNSSTAILNHVPGPLELIELEWEVVKYNVGFSNVDDLLTFLKSLIMRFLSLGKSDSSTQTDSSAQLSHLEKLLS